MSSFFLAYVTAYAFGFIYELEEFKVTILQLEIIKGKEQFIVRKKVNYGNISFYENNNKVATNPIFYVKCQNPLKIFV